MGIVGKVKSWISKTQVGTRFGYKPPAPTTQQGSGYVSSTDTSVGGSGQAPSWGSGGGGGSTVTGGGTTTTRSGGGRTTPSGNITPSSTTTTTTKINLPSGNITPKDFSKGTSTSFFNPQRNVGTIYFEPQIEKRKEDRLDKFVFTPEGIKKDPSTHRFVFIEPPVYGTGGGMTKVTDVTPTFIPSGNIYGTGSKLQFNIPGYEPLTTSTGSGVLEASDKKLDILQKINIKQEQFGKKSGVGFGAASFGLGVGSAFVETGSAILNPTATGKSILGTITHPIKSAQGIGSSIGTGLQINPSFTIGKLTGYYVTGKAIGFGISKVNPFNTITKRVKIRDVNTPQFLETSFTGIKGGKEFQVSSYKIVGEKRPPYAEYKTSPFKETFGIKPQLEDLKFVPSKQFQIKTISNVINQEPFFVIEKVAGSKSGKITKITGSSETFNPRTQFNSLTKPEQFVLGRYGESITGTPMSSRTAQMFFKRESDFTKSSIGTKRVVDINFRTREFKQIDNFPSQMKFNTGSWRISQKAGRGRTSSLNIGITRTKPFLETDKIQAFTSETFFKDISKPFARARGKTPKLEGTFYKLKEPVLLDTATDVKSITPAQITKTSFSKTFQQTKQIQVPFQLPKPIIKTSRVPSSIIKQTGFTTSSSSMWAGTGLYERTTSEPLFRQRTFISTIPEIKQPSFILNKEVSILKTTPGLKIDLGLKNIPSLKQQPSLKTTSILKQAPMLKQAEKQKQMQKLKMLQKNKSLFPRFPIFRIPNPKTPGLFFSPKSKPFKISRSLFGKKKKYRVPRSPSLVAIGQGIKSTRYGRAEFSALGIRPIIISRKRKVKGSRK